LGASGAWAYSSQVQCGHWTVGGIDLFCAGPTTTAPAPNAPTFNDSAYWPGWAVLSLTPGVNVTFDGHSLNDGGTATVNNGNVGIWGAANFDVKGDARISGNAYVTSGMTGFPTGDMTAATLAHIDGANGFVANFTSDVLLWRAQQAALAAAQTAFGLTPTATFAGDKTLTQDLIIQATASNSTVVVNVGGKLDLKNFKLILDGNGFTNVDFVLNVGTGCDPSNNGCGDLLGNGLSGITLAGGVSWADVLINVRDEVKITSDAVSPGGDNRFSGILIAGGAVAATSGDTGLSRTQWTGEIIGFGDMKFDNGSQVTNPGGLITMVTFIPEPGTVLLLLLVGTLLAGFRAWRPSGSRRAVHPV